MKTNWREMPGPWQGEPDREDFEAHGLACRVQRGPFGQWNGYVRVMPGHPFFGVDRGYSAHADERARDPEDEIDVHGGITYSSYCPPADPESDGGYWFGFDCGHLGDLQPGLSEFFPNDSYRDLAWVKAETVRMAAQLADVKPKAEEGTC